MEHKIKEYLKLIINNEKLSKSLMNYLNKDDICNLLLCSKDINSKLEQRNQLLLEIIIDSRIP